MPSYPKVNYIGNKEKLASWIVDEMPVKQGVVLDLFAGGCSVSYALKARGYSVIANDILFADFVLAKAIVENSEQTLPLTVFDNAVDQVRMMELVEKYKFIENRLFFPQEVVELARLSALSENLNGYERFLFLALLRRAMIRKLPYSRMNVPWNQIQRLRDEEYSYRKYKRKRAYHNQSFESHMRQNFDAYNQAAFKGRGCKACQEDAFDLAEKINKVDVVYLDPPYPSTMNNYDAFYGIFDQMFDEKKEHADFTKRADFLSKLDSLIQRLTLKTDFIMLSQNTRERCSTKEIEEALRQYGTVEIKEKKHNYQVTGKENKHVNKELLFILQVK